MLVYIHLNWNAHQKHCFFHLIQKLLFLTIQSHTCITSKLSHMHIHANIELHTIYHGHGVRLIHSVLASALSLCNVTHTCSRFPGVHHCYVLLSLTACMPLSAANEDSLSCHVVFKNLIINYNLPSFPWKWLKQIPKVILYIN